jgi:uracil-DNA glycosylase
MVSKARVFGIHKDMAKATIETAAKFIPPGAGLRTLRQIAKGCTACHLYKLGTQTVFGEGGAQARVVFVGEQPGDKEDLAGKPFVGPAGRLLNLALAEAGIERSETYVTNIVKHFKWEPRGKKRIHKKPNALEILACRPWFEAEVSALRPELVVCLGATAAQAILGKDFRVTKQRGQLLEGNAQAPWVMATVHPSSILRAPDDDARHREMAAFVADLKVAAKLIHRKKNKAA